MIINIPTTWGTHTVLNHRDSFYYFHPGERFEYYDSDYERTILAQRISLYTEFEVMWGKSPKGFGE